MWGGLLGGGRQEGREKMEGCCRCEGEAVDGRRHEDV